MGEAIQFVVHSSVPGQDKYITVPQDEVVQFVKRFFEFDCISATAGGPHGAAMLFGIKGPHGTIQADNPNAYVMPDKATAGSEDGEVIMFSGGLGELNSIHCISRDDVYAIIDHFYATGKLLQSPRWQWKPY